jgi:transcriptional regulator with XRE-family HTH domain
MLKWTLQDLADVSGLGTTTLKRFESSDGVPKGNLATFNKLTEIFEKAGVEFIGTPDQGAGVRWKS